MRKIIFLDIDGVLNSTTGHIARDYIQSLPKFIWDEVQKLPQEERFFKLDVSQIDPWSLGVLRKLVELTEAELVISSVWRGHAKDTTYFKKLFAEYGWSNPPVIGATPRSDHSVRGIEIDQWLQKNNFDPTIDCYVIIDDDGDMLPDQLKYNFVQCDGHVGLTYEHFKQAKEILSTQNPHQFSLFENYISDKDKYHWLY